MAVDPVRMYDSLALRDMHEGFAAASQDYKAQRESGTADGKVGMAPGSTTLSI